MVLGRAHACGEPPGSGPTRSGRKLPVLLDRALHLLEKMRPEGRNEGEDVEDPVLRRAERPDRVQYPVQLLDRDAIAALDGANDGSLRPTIQGQASVPHR